MGYRILFLSAIFLASQVLRAESFEGANVNLQFAPYFGDDEGKQYTSSGSNSWAREHNYSSYGFGAGVGYNWGLDSELWGIDVDDGLVFGLDANFLLRVGDNNVIPDIRVGGSVSSTDPVGSGVKMSTSIIGKIGKIYNSSNFFYLLGGFATADIDRTYDENYTSSQGHQDWDMGWTVGAGAEHRFDYGITTRVEYRYAYYDERKIVTEPIGWGDHQIQQYSEQMITLSIGKYF